MGLARNGRAQHLIEDQIDAVVGVQPRAEVGQTTDRGGQQGIALLAEGLGHGRDDRLQPAVQRAGQGGVNALTSAPGGTAGQQGIDRRHLGRQAGVEQALAHAPGGEGDGFQAQGLDQSVQHQGGVGQGFRPALGYARQLLQRGPGLTRHQTGQVARVGGAHGVFVDDPQRMIGHGHVHLGQAAPGAADSVQIGRGVGLGHRSQPLGDARAQAVDVEPLGIGQGEGAERQGHALVQRSVAAAVADAGQLQAGAAHVGGHAA